MKYMALIYNDERAWLDLDAEAMKRVYAEYERFMEGAGSRIQGGAELQPTSTATTVRLREGETLVTDGPFAETKEQLGGYFVLECDNLDDAIELAAKIPTARYGSIEVRPIVDRGGDGA